jgi:hypothetical protein
MRRTRRFSLTALFAALAMVSLAATVSASSMRWGGEVWGAFNTHTMGDWNDAIDQANASGSNFDNIKSGFSFGVGPTMIVNNQWQFGAHYERLNAKSSEDASIQQKLSPSANSFGVSGMYLFPSKGMAAFGLGLSLDFTNLSGNLEASGTELKIEGSGVGGQLLGSARYAFSPMFSGNLTAGYRLANIDIDTVGGASTAGSSLNSEDYSGLVVRAGLSLSQPASK